MHKYSILLIGLAMALSACVKDDHSLPEPTRVLLVYVGTDNNLAGYEQAKLQNLRNGWTGRTTDHIIVYRDTHGADARLMEISNLAPGESPHEIATYGTENSASPDVFARVIADVCTRYPDADSFGLLVFSHASGWLPKGTLNSAPTRSIIIDNTSEMQLSDFAAAIPNGMFDYIVFEACFMAGIEVAYELRHKTNYILASAAEIIHPGFTPIYAASTPMLFAGDLQGFGQAAFDHTLTYAEDNTMRSATYSVIRTAGLEPLAGFIGSNCDFAKAGTIDPNDVQHFDRTDGHHLFFDFGDYYSRLLNTDIQRAELERLMADCVIGKMATREFMTQQSGYNGFAIKRYSGMTTYIPQLALPNLNAAYRKLNWMIEIQ